LLAHQVVDEQARAEPTWRFTKRSGAPRDREASAPLGVLAPHHEALPAAVAADELVLAGPEQRLERLGEGRPPRRSTTGTWKPATGSAPR
jgi:hypothetical protein